MVQIKQQIVFNMLRLYYFAVKYLTKKKACVNVKFTYQNI